MARTIKRIGRFLDRTLHDIHQGVIDGFDRLWYG